MLDLHNHVLFGLDDGCRDAHESVALAQAVVELGHEGLVATPHIRPGIFNNTPDGIRRRRDEVRPLVEDAGLELHLGVEYYFDEHLLEAGKSKALLTLGETSRYVLTEFPQARLPLRWEDVLFELRLRGYVPVIAHPERCRGIEDDLETALEGLQRAGVLLQLDLGSLIGHYGKGAKRTAEKIVKRGAYHVAACDLHRPEDAFKIVEPAKKVLSKLLKRRRIDDGLERLCRKNPRAIVDDRAVESISPV